MSLHVEQTSATAEANPYLEGPYAATHDEVTLHGLEVLAGEIPDDLNGVYVRNGPNPQQHPMGRYHWFDGDGMVHRSTSPTAAPATATAGCAPRASSPSATPGAPMWRGIMEPFAREPAPRRPRRTPRTPTSCSTATGCSRPGTGPASRTRSTRVTLETLGAARLRRHAALRGLRAREGGRAHRRADVLRLRGEAAVHALRRRRPGGDGAPLRRRSTCPARACRTTWRSPSATRS